MFAHAIRAGRRRRADAIEPSAPEHPPLSSRQSSIELAAVESIQFDTDLIEPPGGEDFCIAFVNNDAVPHDVGIVETGFDGNDIRPRAHQGVPRYAKGG